MSINITTQTLYTTSYIEALKDELSKQKTLVENLRMAYVNLENKYTYDIGIERQVVNAYKNAASTLKQKKAEKDSLIQRLTDGNFKEINELQEQLKMHQDADRIRSYPQKKEYSPLSQDIHFPLNPFSTNSINKIGNEITCAINQQKVNDENIRIKAMEYALKYCMELEEFEVGCIIRTSKLFEAFIKDGK